MIQRDLQLEAVYRYRVTVYYVRICPVALKVFESRGLFVDLP